METNFKNLKTEKEKIEFLKEKIKEYFIPFERGGYITMDKFKRWSFSKFPTWQGFFSRFNIMKRDFEKFKPNFELSAEIERANNIINDILIKGGLSGGYNPKFATLAAQNLIGWSAKSETKETSQKSIIINILNERKRRKLPTIMETTAKKLTKQAKLVKLAKKSSLHSDNSSEDIPVEVDKLGDS